MKKKSGWNDYVGNPFVKKLILMSKITFVLFFVGLLQVSAATYAQMTKLNLKVTNASIVEVFEKIESQSEFRFFYDNSQLDLKQKVSLDMSNQKIEDVLKDIFKNTSITYEVMDRHILVTNKGMAPSILSQNTGKVKGKVTNASDNQPIPGATVLIKGTTTGAITDLDGNYSIAIPAGGKVIVFSFIGMATQEVLIGNQTTVNIALRENVVGVDEVVVIGYGSRAKKDITTAISTISNEDIGKSVSMSSELSMQGKMSGVQVSGAGGNPMARPTIRIRGVNTWGVSSPLYIIDGVPVTEFGAGIEGQEDPRASDVRGPLNIMTMIDPNDIESISVLKDASAAAIYGVRAANGVILITTKKGKGDKPVVEFSTKFGVSNITQSTDVMNTQQYTQFIGKVMASDPSIAIAPENVGRFDPTSSKYLGNSDTYNWQEAIKNKNALTKDYSVRISGGTEKTDYFVSGSSTDMEGAYKMNYLDRLSGSFKINTKVNDWLKVGANYRIVSAKGRDFGPSLVDAATYPAWQKIYDPSNPFGYAPVAVGRLADGSYSADRLYGAGTRINVLGQNSANDESYKSMRNMGNIYVEIEPLKHLKIKGQMSMDIYSFTKYTFRDYDGTVFDYTAGDRTVPTNGNSVGNYEERDVWNNNYINELTVTYNNTFGKHGIDLVFNGSDQQYNSKYKGGSTEWMQSKLPWMRRLSGESKYLGLGSDMSNSALEGLMGRASYNYNSTYYLDVTVRHDGSSRFAPEKRWGTFPSVSGAWRISKESFMTGLTFVNDLKLRAGYGQLGNQEVRNMAYLSPIDNRPIFQFGINDTRGPGYGNRYEGAAIYSLANADLQWEKTSTINVGIDATMFDNKLTASFEYYNKLTTGILQTVTLPLSLGIIDSPVDNIAEVRNTGVELSLNYNNKVGDLTYSVGANISTTKNIVEKTSNHIPIGTIEEGYSMNYIKGFKTGGIFQNQAEVDAWKAKYTDSKYQTAKVASGDFFFLDQRSAPTEAGTFYSNTLDNKIDDYDQVYLGKTIPGYFYGFNVNLDYKGFDFNAQFTGVGDVQKVNFKSSLENVNTTGANQSVAVLDAWTSENHSATLPRSINGDPAQNYRFSDRFVEDAGYLRLSNLQLGYTLPGQAYKFMKNSISNCRVYLGASNLFTITKYSGYDPENDGYPTPLTVFMGLNFRF